MDQSQLADFLLTGGKNDNLTTYANRLALRLFTYPAVILSLQKIGMVEDGKPHVDMVFQGVPSDMLETLRGIIGNEDPMETYVFRGELDRPLLGIRVFPRDLEKLHDK